ncbi:nucleoside hydrolase [Nocardia cyriacigeorgica]|uniref:Nucleoside hydrolase n=1 Tax=Nocardia cyriacigeorgica TaxID=135487 RepID=A0A5R8P924_9NOCA|nr:nucleoside hydrolase [Nocardia cyriacigeorgica]TLG01763.1 nucleoside hydrolase [Nocardia cyriacigeorgica]
MPSPTPLVQTYTSVTKATAYSVVVVDTDIGYDADDIVALAVAARVVPNLVVVTSDEIGTSRARLARRYLDALDRSDVPVLAGCDLGSDQFLLQDRIHATRLPRTESLEHILRDRTDPDGLVLWVGLGPLSNLAQLARTAPDLTDRICLVQMGGWLDTYRDPTRASHNLHTDQRAAGLALRILAHPPRLILSEHTNHATLAVGPESPIYQKLCAASAPEWAQLAAANLTAWFTRRPASWMQDPVTLAAALGHPLVAFTTERLHISADARLRRHPTGRTTHVSSRIDHDAALTWIADHLHW